jgi:protocatechuate 3,4-dioxygenase beta subunit
MNRNKFLSLIGLSFIGTAFFASKKEPVVELTDCNDPITPPVPEGPYYKNEHLNRVNITETKKGTPLEYVFKVEDKHCKPIPGAIVDIWQCDADGHYSDFGQEGTANQTWLRGFQKTNARGECTFTSIFPGWYTGRLTHVHAKVIINGAAVLTTNFFFKKEIENEIHQLPFYTKGPNPVTMQEDFELRVDKNSDRHDTLVMHVAKDNSGKLVASYTIAIV